MWYDANEEERTKRMKIRVDTKDFKRLERQLKTFKARAYPFATKATLNTAAFQTQDVAKKRIRNSLILRNKFILQSVRVNQTKTLDIKKQAAFIGSTSEAMETQEFGGTKTKRGRHGVAIPTSFSAGQGEQSRPRRKLPRPANTLRRLSLRRGRRRPPGQPRTNKQALLFKVQDAVKSGSRTFFHKFSGQKTTGVYRVKGGRKGFRTGWPKGAKIKLLYSLDEKVVNIPRKAWLKPAVDVVEKRLPSIHVKSLEFQLKRHGLFNN